MRVKHSECPVYFRNRERFNCGKTGEIKMRKAALR